MSIAEADRKFHERRRRSIGGSDAPAVLGVSPWRSRWQVWAEKCGLSEPEEIDAEMRYWGHALEPVVIARLCEEMGCEVVPVEEHIVSSEHKHMACHPDAVVHHPDYPGIGVVDVKTAMHAEDWDEEPPLHYQVQIVHNMIVTGAKWGVLACLLYGRRFRYCVFVREEVEGAEGDVRVSPDFERHLIETERSFWENVELGEPPSEIRPADLPVVAQHYAAQRPEVVALPPEAEALDDEYADCTAEIKRLEQRREAIKAELATLIGQNTAGTMSNGGTWKWTTVNRKAYEVEAKTITSLRRTGRRRTKED